jgi:hypothetical protein
MVAQSFEVSYMICGGGSTFTQYLVRFLSNRAVVRVVRVRIYGRSRSHDAGIRVYDDAGNVTETQKHKCEFRDWSASHVNKKPPRLDA